DPHRRRRPQGPPSIPPSHESFGSYCCSSPGGISVRGHRSHEQRIWFVPSLPVVDTNRCPRYCSTSFITACGVMISHQLLALFSWRSLVFTNRKFPKLLGSAKMKYRTRP